MQIVLHDATRLEVVHIDEPGLSIEGDADGEGFGPLQMLAASLALCTASVLHVHAHEVAKIGVGDLAIEVRWRYAADPMRVDRIETVIRWPSLPERRRGSIERVVAACTVHRTLELPPVLITRLEE